MYELTSEGAFLLTIEDVNVEAGVILQEIQAGYMMGDRLLRPSLVSVAKKKNEKSPEKEENKGDK